MKLGLQSRLLLSHVIVMVVGLFTLVIVGKVYSPQFFVLHLKRIEARGVTLGRVRYDLVNGFETAWSRGAAWSVLVGGGTAGLLSYWVAQRIMEPLREMERVTERFAQGQLNVRLPENEIPELARLSASFNQMAMSLENVEQRRRELVGDLTHELRTPLTILQGYLEGLSDGTVEPSGEMYARLSRETVRLRRLVDDLQELSKAEAGYLPVDLQPLNVCPVLKGVVERFADQLCEDALVVRLDCALELPLVRADRARLEQILVNLVSNALRFTSQGFVSVRAWAEPTRVWIAVQDTGCGIAAADLPHVFERFWRSERSRRLDAQGTGVGLAIVQRLVVLQGGEIEVESEVGEGSVFRFSLLLA